ncbi:MAG: hypothetical protein ACRC4G_00660 [Alphaproteobacteria bacterium]
MLSVTPPSPALLYEKTENLLGGQLAQMIRPLFDCFEEEGLFGASSHASFVTYVLSKEMGKALAESSSFEPFVEEFSENFTKQGK